MHYAMHYDDVGHGCLMVEAMQWPRPSKGEDAVATDAQPAAILAFLWTAWYNQGTRPTRHH